MSPKPNARTIRTRRQIHDALLALAEDHDVASINVHQVTRAAGLNRTTFYLHYSDIDALIHAVIDELMERLNEGGQQLLSRAGEPDDEWQETFFRTIGEHRNLFLSLFRSTRQDLIVGRLLEVHRDWFTARWRQLGHDDPDDGVPIETRATFAAYGVHGLTVDWLERGLPEPPETLCAWAMDLGTRLVNRA